MKVSAIYLAIQPYGASGGVRALNLDLSTSADAYTPAEVIRDIKLTLDRLDEKLYEDLLTGKLHLVFRSSDGDPVEQREAILAFLQEGLSDAALDLQVKQLKLEANQLRPPFIELHTQGKHFTGQDMFYENFNYVVCDIRTVEKPEQPFALVEISKHAFSTFVFHIRKQEDWDTIVREFIEPKYIIEQRARIFLVAAEGTHEEMLERTRTAADIAYHHGVRVGVTLDLIST